MRKEPRLKPSLMQIHLRHTSSCFNLPAIGITGVFELLQIPSMMLVVKGGNLGVLRDGQ